MLALPYCGFCKRLAEYLVRSPRHVSSHMLRFVHECQKAQDRGDGARIEQRLRFRGEFLDFFVDLLLLVCEYEPRFLFTLAKNVRRHRARLCRCRAEVGRLEEMDGV